MENLTKTDEFEVHTIPTGAVTILHVMRQAASQNKGNLFKRAFFFLSRSPLLLVHRRQEMSLDIKVSWGSDSLPLLSLGHYTWHRTATLKALKKQK